MPQVISCGLLLYSTSEVAGSGKDGLRVLLAHPGGPFFAGKDEGAWSIPKGLVAKGEDFLDAAKREFAEETGYDLSGVGEFLPLGEITLKSGKVVHCWAFAGHWEEGRIPLSNSFSIEWPPRSGVKQSFPEIDRAELFTVEEAYRKINERQRPFLARLVDRI